MIKHNPEEYIFFHTTESFYDPENNLITEDQFKSRLSDNEKVSCEKTEIKLLYNDEGTKLKFVVYNQHKKFVTKKTLNRVIPKKTKTHSGFTIDLLRKNIYTFNIQHDLKQRKVNKSVRCNVFYGNTQILIDKHTRYYFTHNEALVKTLCRHLNLPVDYYKCASELLFAYYLKSRNIKYPSVEYIEDFYYLFNKNRKKKYSDTDIFQITQDVLGIKNIDYVKYIYKHVIGENIFYYMVVFDQFDIPLDEIKNKLFEAKIGSIQRNRLSMNDLMVLKYFYNTLKDHYKFRIEDFFDSAKAFDKLRLLHQFYCFDIKVNVENINSINKIRKILNLILYCMTFSTFEDGYVEYNPESIEYLEKKLGVNYHVNYSYKPKQYYQLFEQQVITEENITNFILAEFTVQREDGKMRTLFADQSSMTFQSKGKEKYLIQDQKTSKFSKVLHSLNNDFEKYQNLFSVKFRFSQDKLVTLCKKLGISPIKYISKI